MAEIKIGKDVTVTVDRILATLNEIDATMGKIWDSLEPEEQEKIALSTGLKPSQVRRFEPMYTYWKYCMPISKNRLIPAIVDYLKQNPLTAKELSINIETK